ncbi:MAG: hypothetical protein ACI90V_013702 [Bacillariaceae sp.]|jgi:hypothetical protein
MMHVIIIHTETSVKPTYTLAKKLWFGKNVPRINSIHNTRKEWKARRKRETKLYLKM